MAAPSTWRLLRTPPGSGPWNMAVDVALGRCLGPDEGVLRLYSWSHPTLSLGRNQSAVQRYRTFAAAELSGRVVRRPTGGGEVLHDRELTYSVVLPSRALGGPRATYKTLHSALLEAILSLGIRAQLAQPEGASPKPDDGICFGRPVMDEIEASGRKVVGSAQARISGALLQHGSVLPESPTGKLATLAAGGTSLAQIACKTVSFRTIARAVEQAMRRSLPGRWRLDTLRTSERRVAASLLPHYESDGWTWRR